MEYQIFHTLEESENYCSSTSIDEKKNKLLFDSRKDPFNTNSSLWGTSSVEFLKILLCTLYQIRDIYSNYESLNWLEKHGLAHLIVSATDVYKRQELPVFRHKKRGKLTIFVFSSLPLIKLIFYLPMIYRIKTYIALITYRCV